MRLKILLLENHSMKLDLYKTGDDRVQRVMNSLERGQEEVCSVLLISSVLINYII